MALGKGSYLEEIYLDWRFALGSYASADALKDLESITDQYVALFKGDPEGAGVEVSGTGYARQALGWGASNFTRTDSEVTNDNDIDFTASAGSDWAPSGNEVTHMAIMTASSGGDIMESAELDVPRIIMTGDPVSFLAGQITWLED